MKILCEARECRPRSEGHPRPQQIVLSLGLRAWTAQIQVNILKDGPLVQ